MTTAPALISPADIYLASLPSETGRDNGIRPQLRAIARMLGHDDYRNVDWRTLSGENVRALLARMIQDGRAPNTVRLARAALRGVARTLYERGDIDERTLRSVESVKAPGGKRLPAGRDITDTEKAAMMDAAATLPPPRREMMRALLAVLMSVGPRVHEVAQASLEDINPVTGEWRIIGKGNKERMPPLNTTAMRLLGEWLALRGSGSGPLFCAINKAGTIRHDGHMTPKSVREAVQRVGKLAGADVSTHDFRRTFCGDLIEAGVDLNTAMGLTGHAKTETFLGYDRRKGDMAREAVELVRVPV